MNPDPFEEELARVPLRPPPPAWREEILTNVLPASCRQRGTAGVRAGRMPAAPSAAFGAFCSFCRTHLSPGWSAVAAVWLVILSLNRLAASGDAPSVAARPLSPDFLAAVRSQQAELLRLAELDAPVPPPPPAPATTEQKPRPRGPRAHWPNVTGPPEARLAALDCGGKRSATPLWAARGDGESGGLKEALAGRRAPDLPGPVRLAKAPSPLRSAGALQDVSLEPVAWNLELGA